MNNRNDKNPSFSNKNLTSQNKSNAPREEDPTSNQTISVAAEVSARISQNRFRLRRGKKIKKNAIDLKAEIKMDEHLIPLKELYDRYGVDCENGFSSSYADPISTTKPNSLTPPKQTPEYIKFLLQLFGGFSILLWIGGILSLIAFLVEYTREDSKKSMDNLFLGIVLICVVILTASFSYYQESKSNAVMKGFLKLQPQHTTVLRDKKWIDIEATKLIVGDIVNVSYGNVVPADIRIITSSLFKVDNSSLTGEPEALSRIPECTNDNPMETKNLAFYSTFAVEGSCTAIVVRTGDDTFIGKIANLVGKTKKKKTPINVEINRFIHIISAIAIALGVSFFAIALIRKQNPYEAVVFLIGIIVANVPEGLLATVTVSLTLTAQRMAKKYVLVKNLEAVETLGSTSCICSDKTGTLTQNRMTVNHLWYNLKILGIDSTSDDCYQKDDKTFKKLYDIAVFNSKAEFDQENRNEPISEWKTRGDASESALIKFCHAIKSIEDKRNSAIKVLEIPFNSSNKFLYDFTEFSSNNIRYSLSIWKKKKTHVLYMKGAPERVFDCCNRILVDNIETVLNDDLKKEYEKAYSVLGGFGERVLGFAYLKLDPKTFPEGFVFDADQINFPIDSMVFAGLYALIDPPRPAVPAAVKECQTAGIRVIMVTGDHPLTAKSIARSVNIISDETVDEIAERKGINVNEVDKQEVRAIVINGQELKEMENDELKEIIVNYEQIVFARTSPQQKLVIVEAVQKAGYIVAVTGDGVNDSPALRQANIGVAMGIAGTDVSKSAADMILLNDDFSSIVKGVEEGRLIFDNLKKSIAYTLTSNIPEITPFLMNSIFALPLPLSTILILCVDLGTDMLPAISLAYEKAESDIMLRAPRNPKKDNLVTHKLIQMTYLQIGVIQALAGFFSYFVVMSDYGFQPYDLFYKLPEWDNSKNNALADSYGQMWTYDARIALTKKAQSAFFLAIIQVQWADLIICKTRMLSVLHQGMRNHRLTASLLVETVLAIIIIYALPMVFQAYSLEAIYWITALPFSSLIFFYDEIRKWIIRKNPNGWVYKEFYY